MQKFPHQLTLTEWRAYHECFLENIYDFIKPENSVDARDIPGGTSRRQVLVAIETAKRKLNV
jgi:argininosuccinate lyase